MIKQDNLNSNQSGDVGIISSPLFLILAAAILWSTGGLFIKWTLLPGFELSFYRSLFAALTVTIVTRRLGFGLNAHVALASIFYAALLLLFVLANKQTSAANAIFLQYTAPVYLLVLEPLLYKERFRWSDLLTVALCIMGMSLFFVGQLDAGVIKGNILALGSGVFLALYFLILRHARVHTVNRASSVIYGNLLLVLVTAPWGLSALSALTMKDFMSVAYLGVVQIGLAYALFTLGMARGARSLDAGIVCYIEPVLNPLWVFLFLGERPTRWALLGGAIIIAAVLAHTVRKGMKDEG